MQISVIVIGDELLIGQVTDTNSGMIARTIAPYGWKVRNVATVGDNAEDITRAIDQAFSLTDVVITTGGLGPTKDDLTKQVLCDYFGGTLQEDPAVTQNILEIFSRRGLTLNRLTAAQALVPTSCRVIQNSVGTAPIMWFERPDGKVLVSMPGVPYETRTMLKAEVLPQLLEKYHSDMDIAHATLMVAGFTESALAETLEPIENALPAYLHLAYLPKPGLIRLRVDAHGHGGEFVRNEVERVADEIATLLGTGHVLSRSDLTAAEIMLERLRHKNLTIATAESCTGGNIAHQLTLIPGASDVVEGGIVSYSNDVKMRVLGVKSQTLEQHGAVSMETVREMTAGAMAATGAKLTIATSGIAGPGGGTPDKPVGTVWIAARLDPGFTDHKCVEAWTLGHFTGSRDRIIDTATTHALLLGIHLIDQIL
ncbi:MAG: CinA family nicotinamide mononucleotide deamidase-related protein [Muribaculaceae bacterium]|nr:CinA family nicotinamide mononucleotide deamidase-related protein [Muribaculaceae bacterium]